MGWGEIAGRVAIKSRRECKIKTDTGNKWLGKNTSGFHYTKSPGHSDWTHEGRAEGIWAQWKGKRAHKHGKLGRGEKESNALERKGLNKKITAKSSGG